MCLKLGKWAKGKDSLLPAENIPGEGKIYPLASSWVSPIGLAEKVETPIHVQEVVGGSHPFSPNHVQEYTLLYPEVSYPENGRRKSKNTINMEFLALGAKLHLT